MKPLVRSVVDLEALKKKGLDKVAAAMPDDEIWVSDEYTVMVNRNQPTGWIGEDGKPILVTWLSIRRADRGAIHDWRHFQWIKNQIVGEENEGMEIYPAESRLVDSANSYHLFVFENPEIKLSLGFPERNVTNKALAGDGQRPFPKDRIPADAEANYKKTMDIINKIQSQP